MLPVSMPEICTLGHTRLAGVSWRWMPSSVVRPSGRETVRSPAAETRTQVQLYKVGKVYSVTCKLVLSFFKCTTNHTKNTWQDLCVHTAPLV